jgi:hypothetical protein
MKSSIFKYSICWLMIYTYYTKDIWLKDQLAYGLSMTLSRPHHPTLGIIQLVDIPSPVFPAFFQHFSHERTTFFSRSWMFFLKASSTTGTSAIESWRPGKAL